MTNPEVGVSEATDRSAAAEQISARDRDRRSERAHVKGSKTQQSTIAKGEPAAASAAHKTLEERRVALARLLLSHGAHVLEAGAGELTRDRDAGETPVHYCARAGRVELLALLLEHLGHRQTLVLNRPNKASSE